MLGVGRTATDQEIKSAYRKLAMQCHPDRNPDNPEAEEQFKECSEAYAVLADAEKRARYDRFGHAGVAGNGSRWLRCLRVPRFQDIFGDIFGFGDMFGSGRGGRRSRAQRGADMREDLTLEFEEAVFGVTKQVQIRRLEECDQCKGSGAAPGKAPIDCTTCGGRGQVRYQQGFFAIARPCGTCQGSGKLIIDPCSKCKGQQRLRRERNVTVKVPAGVEEGARILYSGEGEAGVYGGPPGDLYVVLALQGARVLRARGQGPALRGSDFGGAGGAGHGDRRPHAGRRAHAESSRRTRRRVRPSSSGTKACRS